MLYGCDTKCGYAACQWIKAEAVKVGKNTNRKTCRYGEKRRLKSWKIILYISWLSVFNTVYQFHVCHWNEHIYVANLQAYSK